MYNLYRSCLFFLRLFRALPLCVSIFVVPSMALSQAQGSFLNRVHQEIVDHKGAPLLSPPTIALWQEAFSRGVVLRHHQQDKTARTAFVEIQAELERQMIKALSQKGTKAVWIFHTPLIATPVVTEGAMSEGLVSSAILKEQDSDRIKTALDRAKLIRLFLNKGGIIVIAYAKQERLQRTPSQIAIFEALKKQYPKQLIDFPIATKHFVDGQYPLDKIGATYFLQEPQGMVEITNRGLQINDAQNDATWGLWLHEREHPHSTVSKRLTEVLSFLEQAGLREKLNSEDALFFLS